MREKLVLIIDKKSALSAPFDILAAMYVFGFEDCLVTFPNISY